MSALRSGDFWSGMVLVSLGSYIIAEARSWMYMGPDGPGAGFFPLWYGIAMVVLSLLLVGRSAVLARPPRAVAWREVRRALLCWLAFMVSVALLKLAGFMMSFALLTWFLVAVMFRRPQRVALAMALGGALAFQLLFDVALGVSLPAGPWHG